MVESPAPRSSTAPVLCLGMLVYIWLTVSPLEALTLLRKEWPGVEHSIWLTPCLSGNP